MDTTQILEALIAERDRLNNAIAALQAPTTGRTSRNNAKKSVERDAPTRRIIVRTPEQREAQRQKMRAYWATKKKMAKQASKGR